MYSSRKPGLDVAVEIATNPPGLVVPIPKAPDWVNSARSLPPVENPRIFSLTLNSPVSVSLANANEGTRAVPAA